jgi:predicted enzyme related to lactoylglutathione lyase
VTDRTRAARIGWNAADSGMPDRSYTIFSMGPTMIGGLMPIPEDARKAGAGPAWMGYIGVDDVDAYAKRVTAAGGAVHRGPEDIPGIGRFAVAGDPHGAGFIIFKGASDQVPTPPPPNAPGHIGWRELHAGNGEAAFAFYSKLFGWTKGDAVDMGPMGVYQVFTIDGAPSGGMMTKMADSPAPHWLYYFNVEGVDAAAARQGRRRPRADGPARSARRALDRAVLRPAGRDVRDDRAKTCPNPKFACLCRESDCELRVQGTRS